MSDPAIRPRVGISAPSRRGYLDWVRGLAVVIMIAWHTLDSWTQPDDKAGDLFWYCMVAGGFAAPLFLFMAGVSVSLASGSRLRKGSTAWQAAVPMIRRGGFIWVLAILFRIQAWLLSPGSPLVAILKVDILNVMGPAIAVSAAIWGVARGAALHVVLFGLAAAATAFLTMPVRTSELIGALWDPLEWYFRPVPGRTTFTLFPWAGFTFAGAAVGVVLDLAREDAAERRANVALLAAGVVLALAGFGASYLPPVHAGSYFWTTSPAFFLLRVGVIATLVPIAYGWAMVSAGRFSLLQQFGRTSLFVYWIHVELVYGYFSYPLQRALPLPVAALAFLGFAGLMFWASLAKTRLTMPVPQAG